MTSIENGREKDEARQIVADFGSKGLVRLTTQGTAYSGMKPGRIPGIGNMPFTGKMETAQAGMPSDQPIGLLLRWISTDGEPFDIKGYGVARRYKGVFPKETV